MSEATALAFVLRLDDAGAARIESLAAGLPGRPDWPPHLTLAVLDGAAGDSAGPRLGAIVPRLAAAWAPQLVTFTSLGVFPGPFLFLASAPTAALLACRAALLRALGPAARAVLHPHARPGAWMPHVTLGATAALPPHVLAALPFDATLDRLELVRFPPPCALAGAPLTSPPAA